MKFEESELKQLSIHQLRKIAREIGVKAPTALTKNALIMEIINVSNGTSSPHFSKLGRPHIQDEQAIKISRSLSDEKIVEIKEIIERCVQDIIKVVNRK